MESLVLALLFKPFAMLALVFVLAVFVYSVRRFVPECRVKRWLLHPFTGKHERRNPTA